MQNPAPIALFVYNRPDHTRRTLQYLKQNELAGQSLLFIFSDAAKEESQKEMVQEVRDIIDDVDGFKHVEVIKRNRNLGLADSIIDGVSRLTREFGNVIVFEDDLICSEYTLTYFNDALKRYEKEERVMHIGAYMYPLKTDHLPQTFFYRAATSWGWATWDRAWKSFEPDIDKLISQFDAQKIHQFSIEDSMNFWKQIVEFKNGRNNSWAIRWYATIFLKGGLTLNPSQSLINNIGHDGTGIHSGINDIYNVIINPRPVTYFPDKLEENPEAYLAIKQFLKTRKGNLLERGLRFLKEKFKLKH